MPRFKSPKGDIIEVTEIHAEQVLRPQGKYTEVFVEEVKEAPVKVDSKESSAPKVQVAPIIPVKVSNISKKKSKKKSSKKAK